MKKISKIKQVLIPAIFSLNEQISLINSHLAFRQNQYAIDVDVKFERIQKELKTFAAAIDHLSLNTKQSITKDELSSMFEDLSRISVVHNPQKGVTWTVYYIDSILESTVEIWGPTFYVKEYEF